MREYNTPSDIVAQRIISVMAAGECIEFVFVTAKGNNSVTLFIPNDEILTQVIENAGVMGHA